MLEKKRFDQMNYIQEIQAKLGSDNAFRSNNSNQQQQFSDYISNEISKFRKDVHQFNEDSLKDLSMSNIQAAAFR